MARLEGKKCFCKQKIFDSATKYTQVEPALQQELQRIVESLSVQGKGILAIDDSSSALESKFRALGLENTSNTRRDYRQMLLSADKTQLCKYVSGVILNHEALYEETNNREELVDFLCERNLIAGIKVDRDPVGLFGTINEDTTEGLDRLQERCIQYKKDGCHFVKWRCTYKLTDNRPSKLAVEENARVLARYASIAQSARMVAIVEPEILTTGEHEMPRALEVHEEVLSALFHSMMTYHVFLEGIILRPSMVLPGIQNAKFCKPEIIAGFTLTALRRTVPSAVPTIMFLSGEQSDEEAIVNLNAINQDEGKKPWTLTFCYGRALHNKATTTWAGKPENIGEAQSVFLETAKQCCDAAQGKFNVEEFVKKLTPDDCDDE